MSFRSGRHFLQIPGPSNVPDRILRAINRPTMDHRGPEFGRFTLDVLKRLQQVFKTKGPVIPYPSSGTGAWEAALVNTLSPGDKVLMFETGQFAILWQGLAGRLGLEVDVWGNNIDDLTRFLLVMNNEAVCDQETGLVWEQSPSTALQPAQAGLISALFLGCYDKIVGGRKGWRWPNVQELTSLSDPMQINPALPIGHPFFNIQLDIYWAYNDLNDVSINKLYGVSFNDGSVQLVGFGEAHFLWCVRGGQG